MLNVESKCLKFMVFTDKWQTIWTYMYMYTLLLQGRAHCLSFVVACDRPHVAIFGQPKYQFDLE